MEVMAGEPGLKTGQELDHLRWNGKRRKKSAAAIPINLSIDFAIDLSIDF